MHCKMSSAICFNLEQSKILSSGNGLNTSLHQLCLLLLVIADLILSSVYTHFNKLKKKDLRKHCEKGAIAQNEQFHLFQDVFYAICILKSFNSHISVVVCSFFELEMVSKWCIRECVNIVSKLLLNSRIIIVT